MVDEVVDEELASKNAGFRHPEDTRVVPNLTAKLALDYSYQFCNCRHTKVVIQAGYQVDHYFNAIDRLGLVAADEAALNTRHTIDTSFDGPYIGIQVNV